LGRTVRRRDAKRRAEVMASGRIPVGAVIAGVGRHPPGIDRAEAASRMTQLRDPMNIMLVAATAVSFAIGQVSTGVFVALQMARTRERSGKYCSDTAARVLIRARSHHSA